MEAKGAEFSAAAFEKRLLALKDSQDSINNCCHWCLENRAHHKKIVSAWLSVLKRVKVEQRVTLFYLANDVIQYSKRRNYEFVESWGTTLQKATTMVRDERVKHKVLRIFKIWEQRGIYNEEFIADLSGLISANTTKKSDDPHEFQASYLINKIKHCTNLENETDVKLTKLKEHNPKLQIEKAENLCASLKDRAHVDDVEKEIEEYATHIEEYVTALKAEIKARTNLISLLVQADTQLESDRKDVKLVASAYKTFGTRVKNVKKKLDEMLPTLSSPIPSPDINAPSPSPDSDLELPETDSSPAVTSNEPTSDYLITAATTAPLPTQVQSAGYYNQLPITSSDGNTYTNNNNFSSFIGSNMPFNLQNFSFNNAPTTNTANTQTTNSYNLNNSLSSFFQALVRPPPPPEAVPPPMGSESAAAGAVPAYQGAQSGIGPPPPPQVTSAYQYGAANHMPLLPPPMPPFSKEGGGGGGGVGYGNNGTYATDVYSTATAPSTGYGAETTTTYNHNNNNNNPNYLPTDTDYQQQQQSTFDNHPPPPPYDPATVLPSPYHHHHHHVVDTSTPYNDSGGGGSSSSAPTNPFSADNSHQWNNSWEATDTPESPPIFEKEGYSEPPIEYHDTVGLLNHGGGDVDHRILRHLPVVATDALGGNIGRGKDVDHRNLISLTGSPADNSASVAPKKEKSNNGWGAHKDKDYRISQTTTTAAATTTTDQDYRIPPHFNLEQLKLPPPPPPPNSTQNIPIKTTGAPLKPGLSPRKLQDNVESIDMDLSDDDVQSQATVNENIKVLVDPTRDEQDGGGGGGGGGGKRADLMPPPPPPFAELPPPDDVDANNLLDDLNNDLIAGEFNEEGVAVAGVEDAYFQGNPQQWMGCNPLENNWMEGMPPGNWMEGGGGHPHDNTNPWMEGQFHYQQQQEQEHQQFLDYGNSFRGRGNNVVKRGGNWGQRGGRARGFRGGRGHKGWGRGGAGFRGGNYRGGGYC